MLPCTWYESFFTIMKFSLYSFKILIVPNPDLTHPRVGSRENLQKNLYIQAKKEMVPQPTNSIKKITDTVGTVPSGNQRQLWKATCLYIYIYFNMFIIFFDRTWFPEQTVKVPECKAKLIILKLIFHSGSKFQSLGDVNPQMIMLFLWYYIVLLLRFSFWDKSMNIYFFNLSIDLFLPIYLPYPVLSYPILSYLFIYLSNCLSIYLSLCLSLCVFIYLTI